MARGSEEAQRLLIPLRPEETLAFLGHADRHLKRLRALFREAYGDRLRLVVRGDQVELSGDKEAVEVGERVVRDLLALLRQGAELDDPTLEQAVALAQGGEGLYRATTPETELALPGRLRPKTPGQRRYVEAIAQHDITFGVGPAGTGKTYLAVAMAVSHLRARKVKRIVLTRPAVEAGEKLGFLPGDIQAKVDPYLRPLYDALFDMIDAERFEHYLQSGIIEVAPLAFMRGRTLNDAFIILDEAQNTTPEQMKMFLTRMGFSSKMVITGDITQIDLPKHQRSGLIEATRILKGIEGIAFIYFRESDVVRHPLVARIIKAYEEAEGGSHRGP
ncbi:PhoH family protein [Thermus thermamylovorans]|uniref:PhoH-like protein n=1 Tax=Thermus thermamylovorans TaxID=2509362 RepID=A0A4Q9B733_9DEIN|nr:PhoH family protein [Thermus thermamylovorans]TBH21847.1 PhoH family protein [Thermus thermamylovorans]